jgi:asparagine synthase (glutamine-hydrolysing)
MCGITGIVTKIDETVSKTLISKMVGQQTHRGPDETGIWCSKGIALGHNRLSIIDLSSGQQPMHACNERYTIVFNGEIYNYKELREKLKKCGEVFSTSSDTEVLLKMYVKYGVECLSQLNGMFAFSIWDSMHRKLFIARDRVGVKPLYYKCNKSDLFFASEISSLYAISDNLSIDHNALLDYLNVLYVPSPKSIFTEINKLPPAHYLMWDAGSIKLTKYWDPWNIQPSYDKSENEIIHDIEIIYLDSVKKRLISDVPLGAFLSGGVDSSAVVAAMSKITDEPVKTFSIGFEGDPSSELPFSRKISELFKTDHHEKIVSPPDIPQLLDTICSSFGEPFADSSALPTLLVSEMARDNVTVALSGDGGDELFAGYNSYYYYKKLDSIKSKLGPLSNLFGKVPLIIPNGFENRVRNIKKVSSFLTKFNIPLDKQWAMSRSILSRGSAVDILNGDLKIQFHERNWSSHLTKYFKEVESLSTLDQITRVDIQTYLPDDLLVKVDRMSMAKSLEVRSPFLDYKLVEYAMTVPMKYKLQGKDGKWIFKKMLEKYLPKEILYRKKQGFSIPLEKWFRNELFPYAYEILTEDRSKRDFIDIAGVKKILNEHKKGYVAHDQLIWALLILESWFRKYIDK